MFVVLSANVIVLFDAFILFKSCCSWSWKWFLIYLNYIGLLCEAMGRFIYGAAFNAGGYFQTNRHALAFGNFSLSLSSSSIEVSLGCLYYFHTKVCSEITSGGNLCHAGTSKLICETNRWSGSCVVRFLPEGSSEQTMILHLSESGKYTRVLCFSIRGGHARVPAPSLTLDVECFMERSLMCWVISGLGFVFHFGTSEVKWRQEDTIAL